MVEACVVLDEDDFRKLVSGGEVRRVSRTPTHDVEVRIILSDIGWDRMEKAITDAALGLITKKGA